MHRFFFLTVILILVTAHIATAQGCSDAGFCTIGELKESIGDSSETYTGKLSFGVAFGSGEDRVTIVSPFIQYDHHLNNALSVQGKLTYNYADGRLGSAAGFGDLYLTTSYRQKTEKPFKWSASLGVKVPLSNANLQQGGRSLPMAYQSGLGTFDLLGGVRLSYKHLSGTIGLQYPVFTTNTSDRQISQNQFYAPLWPNSIAAGYPSTGGFIRKPDALLKLEYLFRIKETIKLTPGLLAIYHLADDEYTSLSGLRTALTGSEGLTLNLTLNASWSVSDHWQLSVLGGTPLVVRSVRPDGLTRHFVVAPGFSYQF